MNKQKLISVLQSRIAKRRSQITYAWYEYTICLVLGDSGNLNKRDCKKFAIELGKIQKEDKQILKQLIEDARHKQHYVEVVYDMNKELQVLRRELARYKYSVDGRPI